MCVAVIYWGKLRDGRAGVFFFGFLLTDWGMRRCTGEEGATQDTVSLISCFLSF
jgi:hypothetical protein